MQNGDTSLIVASYMGYAKVVRVLVEAGADVAAVDSEVSLLTRRNRDEIDFYTSMTILW